MFRFGNQPKKKYGGPYYEKETRWGFPRSLYLSIMWHGFYKEMLLPSWDFSSTSTGGSYDSKPKPDMTAYVSCVSERSFHMSWLIFHLSIHWPVNYFDLSWEGKKQAMKDWDPHFKSIYKIRNRRRKK